MFIAQTDNTHGFPFVEDGGGWYIPREACAKGWGVRLGSCQAFPTRSCRREVVSDGRAWSVSRSLLDDWSVNRRRARRFALARRADTLPCDDRRRGADAASIADGWYVYVSRGGFSSLRVDCGIRGTIGWCRRSDLDQRRQSRSRSLRPLLLHSSQRHYPIPRSSHRRSDGPAAYSRLGGEHKTWPLVFVGRQKAIGLRGSSRSRNLVSLSPALVGKDLPESRRSRRVRAFTIEN